MIKWAENLEKAIINYELLQVLNYHKSYINSIIQLNNKDLVSCSIDKSIMFYSKDKDKYKKYYKILRESPCESIIQTKENELCSLEDDINSSYFKLYFFNINKKKESLHY